MNTNIKLLIDALYENDLFDTDTDEILSDDGPNTITLKMEEDTKKEALEKVNLIITTRKNNVKYTVKLEELEDLPDNIFDPSELWGYKRQSALNNGFRNFITRILDVYDTSKHLNLNWIDTSHITSFDYLFNHMNGNIDISRWNTENIESLECTFSDSNIPSLIDISNWNISKVNNLKLTFSNSTINCDLSKWDTSNIYSLYYTFKEASINCDLSSWKLPKLTEMQGTFQGIKYINFDFSKWNTTNVEYMKDLFRDVNIDESNMSINSILNLNTTSVITLENTFYGFKSEKPIDLTSWKFNDLHTLNSTFKFSKAKFDISNWDVSHCKNFDETFNKSLFNGDIENWNVENAETMKNIFTDSAFTGELKNWNILNMSAFTDNNYVKEKVYSKFLTSGKPLTIKEVIDLMLQIKSIADGTYGSGWNRQTRYKDIIAPKDGFENIKLKIVSE